MKSYSGRHIHFLGIGGIGVSALAQLAQARGAVVTGSDTNADPSANPALQRLLANGAVAYPEHRAENLGAHVELVVVSAAIPEDNPEIQVARERGVRVVSRADFLGELMAAHKGPKIAVAGTHGKTTTTGMIGVMLQHSGLDPTVFVGGEVPQLGGNIRIGGETGPFVAEACEAYDSFLSLRPDIAVVTNIDADHLDHFGTFENVLASFRRFLEGVAAKGAFVLCMDDPGVRWLERDESLAAYIAQGGIKTVRYGIEFGIDGIEGCVRFADHIALGPTTSFRMQFGKRSIEMRLQSPGRHNILNALAAVAVGARLGLDGSAIADGLAEFRGAGRRQEILGDLETDGDSILVMDDYAHHPTEIRATLDALRSAYPERRLFAIFQPHLYSRTRDFLGEFAEALSTADGLIVTNIYAAREAPIKGVAAAEIVELARRQNPQTTAVYVPDKKDIPKILAALSRPNDLAVFLGAGDIREQGESFVRLLRERSRNV